MDAAERRAWRGQTAEYAGNAARVGADTCLAPRYTTRIVDADSLFGVGFRIAPVDLGFAPHERLTVTDVTCHRHEWVAPGAFLLWIGPREAYTIWNGVFFRLRRLT